MAHNPLAAELQTAEAELDALEKRRSTLADELAWASRFDPEQETAELEQAVIRLELRQGDAERLAGEVASLRAARTKLAAQTPRLRRLARLDVGAVRLVTDKVAGAKKQLEAHEKELARLGARAKTAGTERDQAVADATDLVTLRDGRRAAIDRFGRFEPDGTHAELDGIEDDLAALRTQVAELRRRSKAVDDTIAVPLAALREAERFLAEHEAEVERLEREVAKLDKRIKKAQGFTKELRSYEGDGYGGERRLIHQQCEDEFGDGSPGKVAFKAKEAKAAILPELRDHKGRATQLRRDVTKLEDRVSTDAARAARVIDAIVIDGNNCCFDKRDEVIGLAALVPLTATLAEQYPVTVVFDASIPHRVRAGEDDLVGLLPGATVHVVESKTDADWTILAIAEPPRTWIVSNDRYSNFPDNAAVREGRRMPHEILAGRVLLHDLDLNLPLADPPG